MPDDADAEISRQNLVVEIVNETLRLEAEISTIDQSQITLLEEIRTETLSARDRAVTAQTAANDSATGASGSATQAATSATAASGSATAAATSATAAANSATAAADSAAAAAASESGVSDSATAAANSATAAAGSATAAATSATESAGSATQSATSATQSASSATAAANSATAAAASQTAAAASETASGNSQAAAATSATNAANSATAAETSATNSEASRVAAEQAETDAAGSATAAAGSATASAGSATEASTSANNASGSATQAASSSTAAGTARDAAQTAQTAAEAARTGAQTAQTAAETAQTGAAGSATAAQTAQTAAETAQGNAATSATESAASADRAEAAMVYVGGRKNLLDNAQFWYWSPLGTTASDNLTGYGPDRWSLWHECRALRSDDAPDGFVSSIGFERVGRDYAILRQYVENGLNLWHGQTITISFWARAVANQNLEIDINDVADSVENFSLTTSWQRFTYTIVVPDPSDATGISLMLDFTLRTDGMAYITGVQIELGSTATNFEYVHPVTEVLRCQRYFVRGQSRFHAESSRVGALCGKNIWHTPMRTVPTFSHTIISTHNVQNNQIVVEDNHPDVITFYWRGNAVGDTWVTFSYTFSADI